jgi:hypothetical protein
MGQQPEGSMGDVFPGRTIATAQGGQNGNHALQDYQMQLMLLEQQNKRRLLMARQEQDNLTNGPGGVPGQMTPNQPQFGPGMSPSGQRPGPSPNPNEQMKRGTPKMGAQNLPGSPMPDGSMPPNRNSPSGHLDPSQLPPGVAPQQYFQQMQQMNGMRPPSSHPFGQGMTPQQIEAMRQNGGRLPNGAMWPGQNGPPQQMMQPGQQPGQPGQQPGPMGTPQQRNAHMPPPPAPTASGPEPNRAAQQTSSPSQNSNAPPTPQQTAKPTPKGKKETTQAAKKVMYPGLPANKIPLTNSYELRRLRKRARRPMLALPPHPRVKSLPRPLRTRPSLRATPLRSSKTALRMPRLALRLPMRVKTGRIPTPGLRRWMEPSNPGLATGRDKM